MRVGDRVIEKVVSDLKETDGQPWVGTITATPNKGGDMYEVDYGEDKEILFRFMWSVRKNLEVVG